MAAPIPTFIPQDQWNNLTVGGINVSVANSVPNITFLSPFGTPPQNGLVGPIDGAVVYLAGTAADLDGGQTFLFWLAASTTPADGRSVFNPFVVTSTPGRWVAIGTPGQGTGVALATSVTYAAGGTYTIAQLGLTTLISYVYVRGGSGATILNLPGSAKLNDTIRIKDSNGIAGTSNITVVGSIDGLTQDVLNINFAERDYVWNSVAWGAG